MLAFADLPYEFVPPKPNALVIALLRLANRWVALPGKNHRVSGIDISGAERFATASEQQGARFIILPNHPTHTDPHVVTETCRRLGVRPAFMTAYDVFARGKLGAWCMQRNGAFSVDREGSDRKSMKCATEILVAGEFALVMFPEGNVYFCNDRVTPFNEGAAYIALRAQKQLGDGSPVFALPLALKYTFIDDVRETVRGDLDGIGKSFGTGLDHDVPIVDEVRRISLIALARYLKQHGHLPAGDEAEPDVAIRHAAEQIIGSLEKKMELSPRAEDGLASRVRKIRAAIHAIRTDPERQVDHRAASHWADEAMLALRILGYAGGYATGKPTLDRVAETVARLKEDVEAKHFPPQGRRRALVEICEPIDLRDHLDAFAAKARTAINGLTRAFEESVQSGIDRANTNNHHLGAAEF